MADPTYTVIEESQSQKSPKEVGYSGDSFREIVERAIPILTRQDSSRPFSMKPIALFTLVAPDDSANPQSRHVECFFSDKADAKELLDNCKIAQMEDKEGTCSLQNIVGNMV